MTAESKAIYDEIKAYVLEKDAGRKEKWRSSVPPLWQNSHMGRM